MFLLLLVPRAACRVRSCTQAKRTARRRSRKWAKPKQSGERNENNANKNLRFYEQNAINAMKMKMNKNVNVNMNANVKVNVNVNVNVNGNVILDETAIAHHCHRLSYVSAPLFSLPVSALRLSVYLFLFVLSLFGSFLVLFGLRLSRLPASTPICVVFYFVSFCFSFIFCLFSPFCPRLGTPPTLQITIRWTPSNKLPTI